MAAIMDCCSDRLNKIKKKHFNIQIPPRTISLYTNLNFSRKKCCSC